MIYSGNCRLGDLFTNRREKGRPGLPILSVTMNDGLVPRDELERKQETELTPEQHLLVKCGDIAYNMMRMWQGAFGLSTREGLVSPSYVVLKPNNRVDPEYATYLLDSPRVRYLLWAYSYGLTDDRLRLYFPDFARIPVNVHSESEQKRIAATLHTWDRTLKKLEELQANTKAMKAALLRRILGRIGAKRYKDWKRFEFGEIVSQARDGLSARNDSEQHWCVELEHVEQDMGVLIGSSLTKSSSTSKIAFRSEDVLFGKLRPYLRKYWLATRTGVCSSEFWVLRPDQQIVLPQYLACLVQSGTFLRAATIAAGSKMPRAEWDLVSRVPFLVPSKHEQEAIGRVLGRLDSEFEKRSAHIRSLEVERSGLLKSIFSEAFIR